MQSGAEDVFQQFLNMSGMDNIADGLQFDFPEYDNANGGHHMLPDQNRQTLDTPMTGTETSMVLSRADPAGLHHHMSPMSSGVSFQSIPTTMMPTSMIPSPSPSGTIVNSIEAQIQFLQQQKLQHQQRELQERQAAFFAQHIPPTPTSLELAPATHNYYAPHSQADHTPQHQALDYRYQHSQDQQEVGYAFLGLDKTMVANTVPLDVVYALSVACSNTARDTLSHRYAVHCPRSLLQPPLLSCATRSERQQQRHLWAPAWQWGRQLTSQDGFRGVWDIRIQRKLNRLL